MSELTTKYIEDIYEKHGFLTKELVLEVATDPTHPLHSHFNWDDTSAAHAHRLQQSSNLIRRCKIIYDYDEDATPKMVRAFVARPATLEQPKMVYDRIAKVIEDPVALKVLVNQFKRDWIIFKRRYEHLAEFVVITTGQDPTAS